MNYQLALDALLKRIDEEKTVPKLLLHSCCAPCSSYVISYLMEHFDITVFYYNPNIYPEAEYRHRMEEQLRLIEEFNKTEQLLYDLNGEKIIRRRKSEIKYADLPYDPNPFMRAVKGFEAEPEGGKRCEVCFRLRLQTTCEYAKAHGFDYFASTLSVSPHKNAVLLNAIGSSFENPPIYLISDFKKREGYKSSILLSKQFELYRQTYCGCQFSLNHS